MPADTTHKSDELPITWKAPWGQKVGDVALILIMLPIFVPLLTGVLMIPLLILVLGFKVGNPQWLDLGLYPTTLLALVISAFVFKRRLWWRITLEQGQLVLGSGWLARRVPCDRVTMIRAASASPSGRKRKPDWAVDDEERERRSRKRDRKREPKIGLTAQPTVVPLVVESYWPNHARVHLRREDAQHCLETLHRHCTGALAIDGDGTEYMPVDPRKRPAARRRLGKVLITSGVVGLVGGLAVGGLGAAVLIGALRGHEDATDAVEAACLLLGALPLAWGGWYAMRRGLRKML